MRLRTSSITEVREGNNNVSLCVGRIVIPAWIHGCHVRMTLDTLVAYEEFLKSHSRIKDETAGTKERQRKYESFVRKNGKFSVIA